MNGQSYLRKNAQIYIDEVAPPFASAEVHSN